MKRYEVKKKPQRFSIVRSQKHKSVLKITFISYTYISTALFLLCVNAERIISLYNLLNCDVMCVCERMCVVEHFSSVEVSPDVIEYHKHWSTYNFPLSGVQTTNTSEDLRQWSYKMSLSPPQKHSHGQPPKPIFPSFSLRWSHHII